jgi:small subunit ribosomal protein S2
MKKEQFLSAGVHIGMKNRTKYMMDYVYKIRPDGLTVMNLQTIMNKLQTAGKFLAKFDPEKILVVAGREQARKPVKKFAKLVGVQAIVGRFLPGTLTNHIRKIDVLLVTDIIADHQAVTEAVQMGVPILALCNVNDIPSNVDVIVPCNNRGRKSIAAIFWAIATFVLRARGDLGNNKDLSVSFEDFMKD